jgi:hypothetical protein
MKLKLWLSLLAIISILSTGYNATWADDSSTTATVVDNDRGTESSSNTGESNNDTNKISAENDTDTSSSNDVSTGEMVIYYKYDQLGRILRIVRNPQQ